MGVTIGAIVANYLTQSLFGNSKEQQYYQASNQGYPQQYNQPASQVGVFEQALSTPSSSSQNKVYWFITFTLFHNIFAFYIERF